MISVEPTHSHTRPERCRVCEATNPWCCRHRWTISYIAVVVTLLILLEFVGVVRGWP